MNVKKLLITGLILSFALAIYHVWVQVPYEQALENEGKSVGVAEVALGYFLVWFITLIVTWYVTKNMDGEKS